MKIAYFIKNPSLSSDPRIEKLLSDLRDGGAELYGIHCGGCLRGGTQMVLSLGGDGTFMSTAHMVAGEGIPILGVNFGRLGFLSSERAGDVAGALLSGSFSIEERDVLKVSCEALRGEDFHPYAINEAGLYRASAEMVGIDASVGGEELPTYWADGLLVATNAGSTAYSLSAGGPICTPDAPVRLLTPVAPHNLNLRPLVISIGTEVVLSARARSGKAILSLDNRSYAIPSGAEVRIGRAPFVLRRVRLGRSNFIDALRSRFFWGQDVRNTTE